MTQEIIAFKLVSGIEIVGRLVEETPDLLYLEKVRMVQMVQTGPQQVGMSLQPYMVSDIDGTISFLKAAMATGRVTPSEEVEKPYMAQTSPIALV